MFLHTDKLKKYFWHLFGVIGIVFFWTGMWDGVGNLGPLKNSLVSLGIGLVMLTLSSFIFKEVTPLEDAKLGEIIYQKISQHPAKHELGLTYHDKGINKPMTLAVHNLKRLEKDFFVFIKEGKEIFIPANKVKELTHNGQTHWKPEASS